jgi:hypothetical protein
MPLCPQITNTPITVTQTADFTVSSVLPVVAATTRLKFSIKQLHLLALESIKMIFGTIQMMAISLTSFVQAYGFRFKMVQLQRLNLLQILLLPMLLLQMR